MKLLLWIDLWNNMWSTVFDILHLNQRWVTTEPNRLAQRYVRNVGFTYVATIPGFTTYRGETVDGLVATQTKEQFKETEAKFLAKGGLDG